MVAIEGVGWEGKVNPNIILVPTNPIGIGTPLILAYTLDLCCRTSRGVSVIYRYRRCRTGIHLCKVHMFIVTYTYVS